MMGYVLKKNVWKKYVLLEKIKVKSGGQANRQPDMVIGQNFIRVLAIKYEIGVRIIKNMMACWSLILLRV